MSERFVRTEVDATEAGWAIGMENLRLYLTRFAGERAVDEIVLVRDPDGFVEAYARGTQLAVRGCRFGERGAVVAAREQRALRARMDEHTAAPAR